MTDVLIRWNNDIGTGGLRVAGADIELDDGIETAVILSLFTDRRAEADDLPAGATDRRGSWGDALDGIERGSHLWLLEREKETPDVPVRAEAFARQALAWMVDDGILAAVAVMAEWVRDGFLGITVNSTLPSGESREFTFETGVSGGA